MLKKNTITLFNKVIEKKKKVKKKKIKKKVKKMAMISINVSDSEYEAFKRACGYRGMAGTIKQYIRSYVPAEQINPNFSRSNELKEESDRLRLRAIQEEEEKARVEREAEIKAKERSAQLVAMDKAIKNSGMFRDAI